MKKYIIFFLCFSLTPFANAESVSEKLTTLSLNKAVTKNSPEVKRTQLAIDRNLKLCDFKDENQMGNVFWHITKEIRNKDIYAESTEIIEGVNAILLGANNKQNCIDILSAYAVARLDGNTHSDAIVGARSLYRTILGNE